MKSILFSVLVVFALGTFTPMMAMADHRHGDGDRWGDHGWWHRDRWDRWHRWDRWDRWGRWDRWDRWHRHHHHHWFD